MSNVQEVLNSTETLKKKENNIPLQNTLRGFNKFKKSLECYLTRATM